MESMTKRRLSDSELALLIRHTFGEQSVMIHAEELTDG